MQGKQKTLDSYSERDTTESEEYRRAHSILVAKTAGTATYDGLIEKVLDDKNIEDALKKVVGNKGAPGIDGMSVFELREWLPSNLELVKTKIRAGKYKPKPVRRIEIPKPDGGVRLLGIPTAVDRLIQQMVAQVIIPIYEPMFSESSFGFRPGRSAHDAIMRAKSYMDEGYTNAVDLDLSKFFDTLNQDILMDVIRETIKDKALVQLIKSFVKAGAVLPDGLLVRTDAGTPQGGPLSPILANIYLDRFDKLMESRGLHFCRYADDIMIFVRTPRAAERVMHSCTNFLEGKQMKLKVNQDKSSFGSPSKMKFLGIKLFIRKGAGYVSVHPKSLKKFKKRVRLLTKRNRGRSLQAIISELNLYLRGWAGYFGIATSKNLLEDLDRWIRRRIRQYVFKQWKKPYNRFRNLMKGCPAYMLGPNGEIPLDWVKVCWGVAKASSYWKASRNPVIHNILSNKWLEEQGLYSLVDGWAKVKERYRTAVY